MSTQSGAEDEIDDQRWLVLSTRRHEGLAPFVVGVISSRLYHASRRVARLPMRANIRFFDDELQAEAAGFQAPKRNCQVRAQEHVRRVEAVVQACARIERLEEAPRLSQLARAARLSQFHFQKVFTEIVGLSPAAYARARRERRVLDVLESGVSVTTAIYEAGFNSPSRFYEAVQRARGLKPADFRRRGRGLEIGFCSVDSPFGPVVAATTELGRCWLEIADDASTALARLRERFREALRMVEDDALATRLAHAVAALAEGPPDEGLPSAIRVRAAEARLCQSLRNDGFAA